MLHRLRCLALLLLLGPGVVHAEEYVVRRGDTLSKIAKRLTGDPGRYSELAALNDIADPSRVEEGTRLEIPGAWGTPQAPTPAEAAAADTKVPVVDLWSPDDIERAPRPRAEEELFFLPALAELERSFQELMIRAAYTADLAWAGRLAEQLQSGERERIEQEIVDRSQAVLARRQERDACAEEAARAEVLLRKVRGEPDQEMAKREDELKQRLLDAVLREQEVWEVRFEGLLDDEGLFLWRSFLQSLPENDWERSQGLHRALDRYRVAFLGRAADATDAEREAASGEPVKLAMEEIQQLVLDDTMRRVRVDRDRVRAAIEAVQSARPCEAALIDAEILLEQAERKRLLVQRALSTGDGDPLTEDARRVAARYAGVLQDLRYLDRFFPNRLWSELWWKAGVAWRLAGDHDQGRRALRQAVAVTRGQTLPVGTIPPSLDTWLREAEQEMASREPGTLVVEAPGTATITVDGRQVTHEFGVAEMSLPPGLHRVVLWVDGSRPIARLVSVVDAEDAHLVWWQQPELHAEDEVLVGEAFDLSLLPRDRPPRRWWFSLGALAGESLGVPSGGVAFTIRYLPGPAGFDLSLGMLAPTRPLWLPDHQELRLFGRVRGGAIGAWRRGVWQVAGGGGVWGDPGLSFGPWAGLEGSVRVREEVRLGFGLRGGYDLTPHFSGITRRMFEGEIAVWF